MTLTETDKKLKLIGAHRNVSRALVFEWHKRYTDGFKETKHKKTLGQNLKKNIYAFPNATDPIKSRRQIFFYHIKWRFMKSNFTQISFKVTEIFFVLQSFC